MSAGSFPKAWLEGRKDLPLFMDLPVSLFSAWAGFLNHLRESVLRLPPGGFTLVFLHFGTGS